MYQDFKVYYDDHLSSHKLSFSSHLDCNCEVTRRRREQFNGSKDINNGGCCYYCSSSADAVATNFCLRTTAITASTNNEKHNHSSNIRRAKNTLSKLTKESNILSQDEMGFTPLVSNNNNNYHNGHSARTFKCMHPCVQKSVKAKSA